jgi:hypothetical protein
MATSLLARQFREGLGLVQGSEARKTGVLTYCSVSTRPFDPATYGRPPLCGVKASFDRAGIR